MSMSEAQKRDAYLEAQQILRLDKKWQHVWSHFAKFSNVLKNQMENFDLSRLSNLLTCKLGAMLDSRFFARGWLSKPRASRASLVPAASEGEV